MREFELKKRTAFLKQDFYEEAEAFFIKKKIKNIFSTVVPEYVQKMVSKKLMLTIVDLAGLNLQISKNSFN